MGMGNYPCHADTVDIAFIGEISPDELKAFKDALDAVNVEMAVFAETYQLGGDVEAELQIDIGSDEDCEAEAIAIIEAYNTLCNDFMAKTGLELDIAFHNKEDRGDEVDGAFWTVDGVYELSEAGKKYQDKITPKAWNVYG